MLKIKKLTLLLLISTSCFFNSGYAQTTLSESESEELYAQALQAYELESYSLAQSLFSAYAKNKSAVHSKESAYYLAISALKQGSENGILALENWLVENKQHPFKGSANFLLGQYWFEKKDLQKALDYYESAKAEQLLPEEEETRKFQIGYCYFKLGDLDQASTFFTEIIDFRSAHYLDASYYQAHIYYHQKAYSRSRDLLEQIISDNPKAEDKVVMLLANVLFQMEDYKRLYKLAEKQLSKSVTPANKELNRLCGEAYFKEKLYEPTSIHLQRYIDLSGSKSEVNTFYKLGFAYYQLGNADRAIDNFKKSGLAEGSIAEMSSFYLGKLYLDKKNLNYAYSAFKTVADAKASDNDVIKEESAFLIGKINFERALYDNAITDLIKFKKIYPKSRWTTESNELLAQSYFKTSNYNQAIAHLESIVNKTSALKSAYQKVTLQQAQLLFNDQKFQQAIIYLNKSVKFPESKGLAAEAYFIKGESHSLLEESAPAEQAYIKCIRFAVSPWKLDAHYALAYIFYNNKAFDKAQGQFEQFTRLAPANHEFYQDGLVRLGDCYYVSKQYDQSISVYDKVQDQKMLGYVSYQKGLIFRLTDKPAKAKAAFQAVINAESKAYGDKSFFQMGELEVERANFEAALLEFNQLLASYPESDLLPYVRARQALCYFNLGQLEESRNAYSYILRNHLNHPVANVALLGLQEVMKRGLEVPNFEQYLADYKVAHPEDSSLEVVVFEAAKSAYFNQKYDEAVTKLKAFMTNYPSSGFGQDAQYYLGDSHYRNEAWRLSSDAFYTLIESGNNAYTTRALDKRGKALIKLKDFSAAKENYRLLMETSTNAKESYLAQEGLMMAYYENNQYDSALIRIANMTQASWKPANAESKISLIKGKILLSQKRYDHAVDEFVKVINDTQGESAAEAKYLTGFVYYQQSAYKNSLEVLFDLNRSYGTYRYWIGKSFILIADNYSELNELLQARATLESVVQNTTYPEIKKEAQNRLSEIGKKENILLKRDTLKTDSIK